jgi:MoaA/NifB/PqqE/SkfB family radical SAM enzyme
MFKFEELKIIELEISNNCQASCPMCPRNLHGGIPNPLLKLNDWTFEDFKTIFNDEVIYKIQKILFCGSFGDPIMNKHFKDMCQYVTVKNPTILIEVNTNGSLRSKKWWKELASVLPSTHNVRFALDGIDQQSHSLYRIGTIFDKVIENATEFINAGGTATWDFIRFKHNEDLVNKAQVLSEQLGFAKFIVKDTRRFDSEKFSVLDRDGNITHFLELPKNNKNGVVNITHILKNEQQWKNSKEISCHSSEQNSIYINANKVMLPCCIKASFVDMNFDSNLFKKYNLYDKNSTSIYAERIKQEEYDVINELGGLDKLDVTKQSIKEIIDSDEWQTVWEKHWNDCSATSCSLMCGKKSPFILMNEQRIEEKEYGHTRN